MKAEIDKLENNKLVNVPTSLNNSKTKVDDLDVGKLKTFPVDLKKNKWYSKVKRKVNNLDNKIPDATT